MTGELDYQSYRVFPEVELAYFTEEAEAYTSATLGAIDASRVSIAQARIGGLVEVPIDLNQGQSLVGYLEAFGVFTQTAQGTLASGSFTDNLENWSGEVAIGAHYNTRSGAEIIGGLGVSGLFTNADAVSAHIGINIPL